MSRALQPPFSGWMRDRRLDGIAKNRKLSRYVTGAYMVIAMMYFGLASFTLVGEHRKAPIDFALAIMWATIGLLRIFAPRLFVMQESVDRRALQPPFM